MSQNIPDNVKKILTRLNDNGFDGYIVGGAVRDYVMGSPPHDWDIATKGSRRLPNVPEVVEDDKSLQME